MRCSFCKIKEAIIHIREYTESGVNKINLCLDCALERGFNENLSEINNFFKNIIKNIFSLTGKHDFIFPKELVKKYSSLKCPSCKTSYEELVNEYKVGCPLCYSVFSQLIEYVIYKFNHSLNYKGKLPTYLKEVKKHRGTLLKLKKELKKSILDENYAEAALIRDKIRQLKKEIVRGVRQIAKK